MARNLLQYAPALVAFGCSLNYDSIRSEIDIVAYPKEHKGILDSALEDISKFEDTANHSDGLTALALVDYIDEAVNPLSPAIRNNILNANDIMSGERFIQQALAAAKNQRSWHISETAGMCTYFGELCTIRKSVPGKRGRKSERGPDEYHLKSSRGIGREQLVTPNLQALYDAIPAHNLVAVKPKEEVIFDTTKLRHMTPEQIDALIATLEAAKSG